MNSYKKLLLIMTVSVFGLAFQSCKTADLSSDSEFSGQANKNKPKPKVEPELDPNICHSTLSLMEKIKFGYENQDAILSERIKCIETAVKGIGPSTAEKLLNNHDLSIAPTSWKEFVTQMKTLSQKEEYSDIYHNTVVDDKNSAFNEAIFARSEQSNRNGQSRIKTGDVVYTKKGYKGTVVGVFESGNIMVKTTGYSPSQHYPTSLAVTYGCAKKDKYCVNDDVYDYKGHKGQIVAIFSNGNVLFKGLGSSPVEYHVSKIALGN